MYFARHLDFYYALPVVTFTSATTTPVVSSVVEFKISFYLSNLAKVVPLPPSIFEKLIVLILKKPSKCSQGV
jgi:hypothetical protein